MFLQKCREESLKAKREKLLKKRRTIKSTRHFCSLGQDLLMKLSTSPLAYRAES